jgi:lysozyme
MHTSEHGIALIKSFEGFPYGGRPYRDAVGVWTIGYGHTENVHAGSPRITQRQADQLLRHDLAVKYEKYVNPWAHLLNQNQYDALVCFVYNLGGGILGRGYSIGRALRAHNLRAVANAILLYDHAGGRRLLGLTRRRQAERALLTHDQRLVAAWRARLERVRAEVRRRKATGQVGWSPGLKALANTLEADIKRHS